MLFHASKTGRAGLAQIHATSHVHELGLQGSMCWGPCVLLMSIAIIQNEHLNSSMDSELYQSTGEHPLSEEQTNTGRDATREDDEARMHERIRVMMGNKQLQFFNSIQLSTI